MGLTLAVVLVSPSSVVTEAVGGLGDVEGLGDTVRLSVVESLDGRELLRVFVEELSELIEKTSTVAGSAALSPDGLVSLLGGLAVRKGKEEVRIQLDKEGEA